MTHVEWDHVTRQDVVRAIAEYDRCSESPDSPFSASPGQ